MSFIVGIILSVLGVSPYDILNGLERLVRRIYNMGFDTVEWIFRYFLLGAVVVVPIWLIMRLSQDRPPARRIGPITTFHSTATARRAYRSPVHDRRRSAIRPFEVTHRGVLAIAMPMTLAYLTTPLVGVVNLGVIGQLGDPALVGGVSIGALVFDFVFVTFNFLRSGTTGLVAQALGADDRREVSATVFRALIVALVIGLAVLLLRDADPLRRRSA